MSEEQEQQQGEQAQADQGQGAGPADAAAGQAETAAGQAAAAPAPADADQALTGAMEDTLDSLSQSIQRMEAIVSQLENGEADWEEAVRLLSEANELAVDSSQRLEQAVQDVVYGESGEAVPEQQELGLQPGAGETEA